MSEQEVQFPDWVDYERVYRRDGFRCVYCGFDCGRDLDAYHQLEVDHVLPQSKGEDEEVWRPDNLVVSCAVCNRLKSAYLPEKGTSSEQIAEAQRYIQVKRRIADEYYRARVLAWRGRCSKGIGVEPLSSSEASDAAKLLRDSLLPPLRTELGPRYQCTLYDRAKKVRWLDVRNAELGVDWCVGVDEDLGLSLQLHNAWDAWQDENVGKLVATKPPGRLETVRQMSALIWAGFDPFNYWARIGPPVFSVPEAVSWTVLAIREAELFVRHMPALLKPEVSRETTRGPQ